MSLSEVKTKACLDTLETLVGLSEFDIDDLFKDVDINGDGLVVKTEVAGAMKNLAFDRSEKKTDYSSAGLPDYKGR